MLYENAMPRGDYVSQRRAAARVIGAGFRVTHMYPKLPQDAVLLLLAHCGKLTAAQMPLARN
jgi:hypothetical protein